MVNSELFPVQVLFLRAPKKVHIQEILAVLLKDLTVRRILKVVKLDSFPNSRSKKTQRYSMIYKGLNYEGYEPQPFEKAFLLPLAELNQVQTKILTNFVLKKHSYPSAFITDNILKPLKNKGYLKTSLGGAKATSKAKPIVDQVNQFLNQQQEKLASLLNGEAREFMDAVIETGSYLFILEYQAPELFEDIKKKIRNLAKSYGGGEFELTPFYEALNLDLSYFHE
ncbi:MAG: hypothetical protein CVU09_00710 [Bacteroidetes bacterium HGW-Bacteroidetes-4]|jgi:hypothetical protein|nr:MAG: hypothetical protein CVU09_00710 [Bacteroidetes bacterium HGW-Bacteroidetes-4]